MGNAGVIFIVPPESERSATTGERMERKGVERERKGGEIRECWWRERERE